MGNNDLLQRVYDATRGGLDIIRDLLPAVDDAVINQKKAFRLRPDERTPSAHLYPPKDSGDCWHVKDFGMGEGGGYFSPVDLYMWMHGYGQDKFRMAVEELAERNGVQEMLTQHACKPDTEVRAALPEEVGALPSVTLFEGFGGIDLSCWGEGVKPEHLTSYGWSAVREVRIPNGDKVYVRRPTPAYPIFAERCDYIDEQGREQVFYKVYEPRNFDKAHRFLIAGKKPRTRNYIYGMQALRKVFEDSGEKKLDVLLLVSGGSDAVSALAMGYQAVWLDSEVKSLSESDYWLLMKYCHRLVNIPDIDDTGVKCGRRLALDIPGIYTAWLTAADMGGLHDNRGRQRKDLKDYIQLHPCREDMRRLVGRAQSALYWSKHEDDKGNVSYGISPARLNYYLALNGYCTLKDDTRKEPVYIHVDGIRVSRVMAKTIVHFITDQARREGLDEALLNKIMRCRDLPTNNVSHLVERDDLDFTRATATSQRFFFRNGWVEVTADGIIQHPYSSLCDCYVWENTIVEHDYRDMSPMFEVSKDEHGELKVTVSEGHPSKLLQFVINASRLSWRKTDEEKLQLTGEEESEENRCLLAKLLNIGYLLHGYKSESAAWATLCLDSTMGENEDECNGRSGKSFFLKALSILLNTFPIDARTPSIVDNRFIFDGVTADTDLICVDECHKKLDFDFFFGKITGSLRGEEKGNHPFLIPFAKSPKFAFASNYVLRKHDPSTTGRLWPQIFSDYYHVATKVNDYHETRSIRDDFGCDLMGAEYPERDWQADIAFMLQCLRLYLSLPNEDRKVMPPMMRIEQREQRAAIGKDFEQWANEFLAPGSEYIDHEVKSQDMLDNFNRETRYNWSMTKLTRHLKDYCEYAPHIRCLNPVSITGRKKDGDPWTKREGIIQVRYYYIQSMPADGTAIASEEPTEQDLPF